MGKLDTPFRALRSAHQSLQSRNCFLVLIDTLSSVANFAPPTILDPSYRLKSEGDPYKFNALLPPFFEVLTSDIFHSMSDLEDVEDLGGRYSRGRPLWKIYFSEAGLISSGINFAVCKLLCRNSPPSVYKEPELIAILSLRFGILGICDMRLGNALVSSHMATLVYLNEERTKMSVRYPAEPALMEAACITLHTDPKSLNMPCYNPEDLARIIRFFTSNWVSGIINVGELGEIVGRMILALTYDHVKLVEDRTKTLPFLNSISVEDFLSVLIPPSTRESYKNATGKFMLSLDPALMKGRISLVGFDFINSLDKNNLQHSLREAFHLGIGVMLPVNFPGLDILIPVYLADCDEMAFIGIQIKLHDEFDKSDRQKAITKMDPSYVFQHLVKDPDNPSKLIVMTDFAPVQPYACILFELGSKGKPFSSETEPSEKPDNFIYIPQMEMFGIMADAAIYDAFQMARNFKMDCDRSVSRLYSLKGLCPYTYLNDLNSSNVMRSAKRSLSLRRSASSKKIKATELETIKLKDKWA